jgi:hypothetical protein
MKKSKSRLIALYSFSYSFLVFTAFLFYINVYAGIGPEFGFDALLSFVALVPFVYVISSVILDIRIKKIHSSEKLIMAKNISLPLFIALHFIVLTQGFLLGRTEAIIFWYFLLLLPLLILIIYFRFVKKYLFVKFKLFIILKYVLSLLLYVYGFLLFFAYLIGTSAGSV